MLKQRSKIFAVLTFFGFQNVIYGINPALAAAKAKEAKHYEPNGFTNNYGYGPFGLGPANAGFDSFGFYKDKFYNSGLPALHTYSTYRNYYQEFVVHKDRAKFPGFFEEFSQYKGRHGNAQPDKFEVLQQERFGPYYNGVWGYADHSPYWYGKKR
uniref:Uncharacterized protein n=1 Tax=Panagrolaimus davidi TaxID=227884 RepID=A0A914PII2_9BILA